MESTQTAEATAIAYLRSPQAIRDRTGALFTLAQADALTYFRPDLSQLESVANYVIETMREQYPDLQIPFHSRWRHFDSDRLAHLQQALSDRSKVDQAKAKFDLVIPSVLLDAGAGDRWQYRSTTGQLYSRSEGLAIASFDAFCNGTFSDQPYQTDAKTLQMVTSDTIAAQFQVTPENPLVGLTGRSRLLQKLGDTLIQHPDLFGHTNPRPGNLVNYLLEQSQHDQLSAVTVFEAVLHGLSDIWSGRLAIATTNLGDVWHHPALPGGWIDQLVPFHKLSQWLTYSLLEPLQDLGLTITDLDQLTGLPEYRNGGLCLDLGLLQVKDELVLRTRYTPDAAAIVEWRALTVCCLDRIAHTIRHTLNLSTSELPLVKVLQGGTWTAGRKIAKQRRSGGAPPIQIESDGTVF